MSPRKPLSKFDDRAALLAPLGVLAFVAILGTLSACRILPQESPESSWSAVLETRGELTAAAEELERVNGTSLKDPEVLRSLSWVTGVEALLRLVNDVDLILSEEDPLTEAEHLLVLLEAARLSRERADEALAAVTRTSLRDSVLEVREVLVTLEAQVAARLREATSSLPSGASPRERLLEARPTLYASATSSRARTWSIPLLVTGPGSVKIAARCVEPSQGAAASALVTLTDLADPALAPLTLSPTNPKGTAYLEFTTSGRRALRLKLEAALKPGVAPWVGCSLRVHFPGIEGEGLPAITEPDRASLDELTHVATTEVLLSFEQGADGLSAEGRDELIGHLLAPSNQATLKGQSAESARNLLGTSTVERLADALAASRKDPKLFSQIASWLRKASELAYRE